MYISQEQVDAYLAKVDLSDSENGVHAINIIKDRVIQAISEWSGLEPAVINPDPIVEVSDNFDNLYYDENAIARDPRYTHYVDAHHIFRTQMTSAIPPFLRKYARSYTGLDTSLFLAAHGLVYRRDVIDRTHVGEPHQLDLWVLNRSRRLNRNDLVDMIGVVLNTLLPGCKYRCNETYHPYTINGLEVEVWFGTEKTGRWVEVLECGEAHPWLLDDTYMNSRHDRWTGLAMGIGLDRLCMLLKGIDDIRLLRSTDPRVAVQMANLKPYKGVSKQPAINRDMSLCVQEVDMENIGGRVREALGERADWLEEIELRKDFSYDEIPDQARERLGIQPGQRNILLRLILRSPTDSIPKEIGNEIYDIVYRVINEGAGGYEIKYSGKGKE
jgi:phenylalanyl-tRNA synthetase alpha chain